MAFESPFYLFKRKLKKGEFWYVCFKDPKTKKQITAKSVEFLRHEMKLPGDHHITRKLEASRIAQEALDSGFVQFHDDSPMFKTYVQEYWDFEKSSYIQRKNKKNENSIGPDYAHSMLGTFNKNAAPLIPDDLKISKVTTTTVENILNKLLDDGVLSNGTIARVMQSMKGPLKEAKRLKLIQYNPMTDLESVTVRSQRRGILTTSELQQLLEKMQQGVFDETVDNLVYLASALSATTGMRQGEIRGLHASSINLINEEQAIITVRQAFASYAGMKGTKGKRDRQVPAPRWLCELLIDSAHKNPYGKDLVFWSDFTSESPVTSNYLRDNFYKALELIDIDEDKRKERKIVFHSLRHYFVTFMRGKISESALREISGHQSEEMTNLYTHATVEQLLEVGQVASNILQFPKKKEQTA